MEYEDVPVYLAPFTVRAVFFDHCDSEDCEVGKVWAIFARPNRDPLGYWLAITAKAGEIDTETPIEINGAVGQGTEQAWEDMERLCVLAGVAWEVVERDPLTCAAAQTSTIAAITDKDMKQLRKRPLSECVERRDRVDAEQGKWWDV